MNVGVEDYGHGKGNVLTRQGRKGPSAEVTLNLRHEVERKPVLYQRGGGKANTKSLRRRGLGWRCPGLGWRCRGRARESPDQHVRARKAGPESGFCSDAPEGHRQVARGQAGAALGFGATPAVGWTVGRGRGRSQRVRSSSVQYFALQS